MPGTPTKSSTQSAAPAKTPDVNTLLAALLASQTQMQALIQAQNQPAAAPRPYPVIPKFVPDPAKPNAASRWFTQVESIFRLQTLTDAEKCSLVSGALDPGIFDRVADALLPDAIDTIADYAKLKGKVTGLFDYSVSLFAERYSALFNEWKGPEPELLARIQRASKCMDGITLAEIQTLMLMAWMKSPSLEKLRTHVLDKLNAKHDTTLDECGKSVIARLQTQRDQSLPMNSSINFVQKKKEKSSFSNKGEEKKHRRRSNSASSNSTASSSTPASCASCGKPHDRRSCRFKNAECRFCKNKGHIEAVCRKKKAANSSGRNVRTVRVLDQPPMVNSFHIQHVTVDNADVSLRHIVDVSINNVTIPAQLDDGADISVISESDYATIGSPTLTGSTIPVSAANGQELKMLGSFRAKVCLRGKSNFVNFQVAPIPTTLLGNDFFESFGIGLVMDGEPLCTNVCSVTPAPMVNSLMKKYGKVSAPRVGNRSTPSTVALQRFRSTVSPLTDTRHTVSSPPTEATPSPTVSCSATTAPVSSRDAARRGMKEAYAPTAHLSPASCHQSTHPPSHAPTHQSRRSAPSRTSTTPTRHAAAHSPQRRRSTQSRTPATQININ